MAEAHDMIFRTYFEPLGATTMCRIQLLSYGTSFFFFFLGQVHSTRIMHVGCKDCKIFIINIKENISMI